MLKVPVFTRSPQPKHVQKTGYTELHVQISTYYVSGPGSHSGGEPSGEAVDEVEKTEE